MPDAQCNKCNKALGEICHNQTAIDNLSDLVNKRASRTFGVISNISPGICHNEVDTESDCDGVLWYKLLWSTPPGIKWE